MSGYPIIVGSDAHIAPRVVEVADPYIISVTLEQLLFGGINYDFSR